MSFRRKVKKKIEAIYGGKMIDTTLRYSPVSSFIKNKQLLNTKILEVGSGHLGITQFLPIKITGVDVGFEAKNPLMKQIKTSATKLPFKDSSFDVVISIDALEHLTEDERKKTLEEMVRVARQWVLINNPCDKPAYRQDVNLATKHREIFGEGHAWIEEHVKNGLPTSKEIFGSLTKSSKRLEKKIKIEVKPNLNLTLRYLLMRSWITKSFLLHVLDRTLYVMLLPLLAKLNWGTCYRKLFVVEIL